MGEIVNQTTIQKNEIIYKVDDKPPLALSIVLALQHILAAFGGIVAVPLVVGQAIGVKIEDLSYLVSAAIFMAGLATFIQAKGIGKCGARVSCMMGTDFSFVSAGILVGKSMGLPGYFGATILGSFVEIILSRFIKPLMKYFPPIVTGTVVTLIGLTLLPVSIDWAAGGYGSPDYGSLQNIAIAMIVLLIALFLNKYGKGIVSSASVLIAIFFGYIICSFLGIIDFTPVLQAKWIELPRIFKYGVKFSLIGVLPFIAPYLVTTIETVGCLIAIGEASEKPLTSEEISAGILADGVGSFLAGFFGAGPNTSFSQNVGLIPLTKVASRYVMIIASILLMLLGIFPKLGALIAIMPNPVLGGAGIVMFGMVAAAGIKTLSRCELNTRNLLILAVSIGLGLGVTVRPDFISHLPQALKMFFGSGISTGTITAFLLNIILKDN